MAAQIASETGGAQMPPEEVARGFLRIAVDNMAAAIKKEDVSLWAAKEDLRTTRHA